jgi:uracil DNA glycosylase
MKNYCCGLIDVFDQQDLSAWVSVVHHAFVKSIKEIMEELKQDITGMNTRSKGYLSVW